MSPSFIRSCVAVMTPLGQFKPISLDRFRGIRRRTLPCRAAPRISSAVHAADLACHAHANELDATPNGYTSLTRDALGAFALTETLPSQMPERLLAAAAAYSFAGATEVATAQSTELSIATTDRADNGTSASGRLAPGRHNN